MKNPLVEALRQANSGDSTSEQLEPAVDEQAVAAPVDAAADSASPEEEELQLMLSSGVLPVADAGILPIDGPSTLPIDGPSALPMDRPEILPIDGPSNFPEEGTDADFYETTSLMNAANQDSTLALSNLESVAAIPLPNVPLSRQRSRMLRLGLYSPLLSVFLAAVTTASYFAYQSLVGHRQNTDLATLLSQVQASGSRDESDDVELNAAHNRFKLIVGPQPAAQTKSQANSESRVAIASRLQTPVANEKLDYSEIEDDAFVALNDAYRAYERGNYVVAEENYRRALELAPRHPNALHGLAAILHRTGRIEESLRYYEALLSVEPLNTAAAAALLAGQDDSIAAATESEIKLLIQRHPNSAHLQFALGTLFARQARWANARHAFDLALRLDPTNADYIFNFAVSLEHLGQYLDARFYYESALQAASATSTLDSEIVTARIAQLELHENSENLVR